VVGNQPKFNDEEEEPTPFAAGSVHGGDRLMPSGQEIGKKLFTVSIQRRRCGI
jgi:hypothetical protein